MHKRKLYDGMLLSAPPGATASAYPFTNVINSVVEFTSNGLMMTSTVFEAEKV